LEDPGVDGWIILKYIFQTLDGKHRLDQSGLGQGFFECDDEPSGSIKCGEFFE
jgi:hypothetical protein